jgi:4-hydroxythreonine-4-phosphate dehydrogenase
MDHRHPPPLIGITAGDEAGVGPEVIIKTLAKKRLPRARFLIYGSKTAFDATSAGLKIKLPVRQVESLQQIDGRTRIHLLNCPHSQIKKVTPGKTTVHTARNAFSYITLAAHDALDGKIDALVTAPIAKFSMKRAGIDIPGHTDYLAELSHTKNYAMMFVGGGMKVILASIHTSLQSVPGLITGKNIRGKALLIDKTLKDLFKLKKPCIAVCGLNPHAGEEGMLGDEEKKVLVPVIKQLRQRGLNLVGPYPSDTIFNRALAGEFDAVLAMYHDQGMVPIKLLAFDTAVNMTIGLPFIRTSPDHGTAFDIAGKGAASPNSFTAALKLAIDLAD